jgi:predicted alpha/beta superfamily hydrolase
LGVAFTLLAMVRASASGIVFEGAIPSAAFGTNRFIRIWTPPSYQREASRRFPVLYVHDGQNAFTTAGTNAAFGWGSWELDRIAGELGRSNRMREVILVAIDCSRERYLDYRGPAHAFTPEELATEKFKPPQIGDNSRYETYRRFLIEEIKPKIDREYRTLTNAADTGTLGSSMGGVVSLALAWDRPDVFGLAASLSGAFQVERKELLGRVQAYRGPPKTFRIHLDSGVTDFMGGDDGRSATDGLANELRRIGWIDGRNLQRFTDEKPLSEEQLAAAGLRRDKWAEAQRSQHNEFYWRLRVWRALEFLFPP